MAYIATNQGIYDAVRRWRTGCLEGGGSAFSDERLWQPALLDDLHSRFSGNLLVGEESFEDKLRVQLEGAPGGVPRLAAEVLWLMLLFPNSSAVGPARKRELITSAWSWSGISLGADHPLLGEPLEHGIGHPGQAYNQYRWKEFGFAVGAFRAWHALAAEERPGAKDPWGFAAWLDSVPGADIRNFRHMLLHLLYPADFERIAVKGDKQKIRGAFTEFLPATRDAGTEPALTSLDRDLFGIREALELRHPGIELDFYRPPLEQQWRTPRARTQPTPRRGSPGPAPVHTAPPAHGGETVAALAERLFLPPEFIAEALDLLRERRQLILYGPPGTGKTYVARALMQHLAPAPERRTVVQFHPSYSYEDFVQGYRPRVGRGGQLAYDLRPGPLVRMARAAAKDRGRDYVLLIDEINRGNLPKIFGELLYLMEYRDQEVTLMYGGDAREGGEEGERFSLPENLLILGTMNTADRSIALVDAALRRRFHFTRLFPGEGPLKGFLERWLRANRPEMAEVAGVVDKLNRELRERLGPHVQVGHSYFTREDLSEKILDRVWEHDVLPLLEDQFFGTERELARFTLDALRGAPDANDRADGA